ncbi:DUF6452 family protein [Flammeovirgaceae bacterium SG7u.111]|nr:DUF6452 family protein [Flammeovirgaceae bacterium SG7u.132]WPO35595.1 DUF6452 family protein [Flammeovirgaceae bacterium SG7u.111]
MKKLHKLILLALLLCSVWACSDCEPISDPGNELVLSFIDYEASLESGSLVAKTMAFDSIYEVEKQVKIDLLDSNIYLIPLPFDRLEASYVFEHKETVDDGNGGTTEVLVYDTLEVNYQRSLNPISPDCGFYEQIQNIRVSNTTYDTIGIFTDQTTSNDTTNIYIFL